MAGTSLFTFDDTGQVTAVDHTHISDESYSFDETGNRTMSGYSTGDANRLSSDGVFNYVYDDEGNVVTRTRISLSAANDKITEYSWDHRNRIVGITYKNNSSVVTKTAEYTYDIFDRRIAKEVDADGAGGGAAVITRYVYDGTDILVGTDANGDVQTRYLHGPAVDQVFAAEDASTGDTLWALTDHLGSVRDIVDDSGNVENHIVYDSFGRVVSETTPAVDFLFGFTGRERDEESGLNYHRARYCDSATGRWISEDPISFSGGDENIYRYVGNDGVNFVDSTGLWEEASESQGIADAGDFAIQFEPVVRSVFYHDGENTPFEIELRNNPFGEGVLVMLNPGEFGGDLGEELTPEDPGFFASIFNSIRGILGLDDDTSARRGSGLVSIASTLDNFGDSRNRMRLAIERQLDPHYNNQGSSAGGHAGVTPGLESAIPGITLAVDEAISNAPRIFTAAVVPGRLLGIQGPKGKVTRFVTGADGKIADLGPTLDRIKSGVKFPHRNDGTIFKNREGLLPNKPAGYWTEHVHPTPGGKGPGLQRIVIGQNGEIYFTPDHYKTFIPLNPNGGGW